MTPPRIVSSLILLASVSPSLAADTPARVSFRREIAPIFLKSCIGCHNDKKASNGLNMSTFGKLKLGGKASGKDILAPGDPKASELYLCLLADASPRMPLKQLPLSSAQIATVERWIREGAKFDGTDNSASISSLVDPLADLPKVALKDAPFDPVSSVSVSPDGRILAAAAGREVHLIDASTGKPIGKLGPHAGLVNFTAFSPDGKTLVAAGGRAGMFGTVTTWDLASRTKKAEAQGHSDAILSADLSRDGKTLVTGSYDRLVKLWEVASLREIRTLREHTDSVHAVAFSPDGRLVASAGADRTVKFWRAADGKRLVSMSESGGEVYALAFSPDGALLYSSGVDRSIRSWRLKGESVEVGRTTFAHDAPVLRLLVVGNRLYSTGEDRTIRVWEAETLRPLATWPGQSDWVHGLAATGSKIAVGRYDGTAALLDPATGKTALSLRETPKRKPSVSTSPAKSELVRPASLNPPSPRGATRGKKVRVTLTGQGVGQAIRVLLPEPGIQAEIVPLDKPVPNRLDVDLTLASTARVGVHRIGVQTPLGIPALQNFVVESTPEQMEKEPNDRPSESGSVSVPSVLIGAISKPGDADLFRFQAAKGKSIVMSVRAKGLGSDLLTSLAVSDPSGKLIATAQSDGELADPILSFTPVVDGEYNLRVADADFGGSGNHFYRLNISETPDVDSAFPLGIEPGRSRLVKLEGVNLGQGSSVEVSAPPSAPSGTLVGLPVASAHTRSVVVASGPQRVETESGDDLAHSMETAVPGGVSGRIDRVGDVDLYRFEAKRGRRLIVEVFGRRLGSPVDSSLEILDAKGNLVPRAVLRPVEQTTVAFRDHGSISRSIRLTTWDHLAAGDLILAGRELLKITDLPRNPDDDAVFWGLGIPRLSPGERIGLMETTPEQHPMGQPMYKVEVHPPGTNFAGGGIPPVTLYYRNDDGGPGFGKDSRLSFDPPADGTYYARVEDAQGKGGDGRGYHLVVREPRPDFTLAAGTENPNIPRGGSSVLGVSISRLDGFNGAVDVRVEGLPPGVTSTSTRIEPDAFAADILLSADESAPAFSPPTWKLIAKAADSSLGLPEKVLDPGGESAGWITVTPRSDLSINPGSRTVTIQPGRRVELTLAVNRSSAFAGRVPIDVRNLPAGVRVLNIGLNGVLVTEKQTERSVFLYAEPWVVPQERAFFAVGRVEASGLSAGSSPINLIVRP